MGSDRVPPPAGNFGSTPFFADQSCQTTFLPEPYQSSSSGS
jgi:hypothetical protein